MVVIANADGKIIQYLILMWFVGMALVPLIPVFSHYTLDADVFILGGFVGYFVLGSYLERIKLRSALLYGLLIASFLGTIFEMWLMTYPLNAMGQSNYFFGYLTVNVIVGSAALFLILRKFQPNWPGINHEP